MKMTKSEFLEHVLSDVETTIGDMVDCALLEFESPWFGIPADKNELSFQSFQKIDDTQSVTNNTYVVLAYQIVDGVDSVSWVPLSVDLDIDGVSVIGSALLFAVANDPEILGFA